MCQHVNKLFFILFSTSNFLVLLFYLSMIELRRCLVRNKIMKIAILDCCNINYSDILQITKKSKSNYAKKYDMDFVIHNFSDLSDRTQHWGRILGIKKHLPEYDYILYLDTDTLILNYSFDIRDLIKENLNYNILTGPLPHEGHIGTNGIIIKNDRWSIDFLEVWFNQKQFIDSPYHGYPSCGINDDGGFNAPPDQWKFFEQSAFHYLYDTNLDFRQRIKLLPRKYLHAVKTTYKKGDFLIHCPGMSKEEKIVFLKTHLKNTMI